MKTLVLTKYGEMFAPSVAHFVASGWDDMQLIAAGFAERVNVKLSEAPIQFTPELAKRLRLRMECDLLDAQRAELAVLLQKVAAGYPREEAAAAGLAITQLIERIDKRLGELRGTPPAWPAMPADPVPGDSEE